MRPSTLIVAAATALTNFVTAGGMTQNGTSSFQNDTIITYQNTTSPYDNDTVPFFEVPLPQCVYDCEKLLIHDFDMPPGNITRQEACDRKWLSQYLGVVQICTNRECEGGDVKAARDGLNLWTTLNCGWSLFGEGRKNPPPEELEVTNSH